jgi:hypothetical protein
MAKTELDLLDKPVKSRIIRLIEYTLANTKFDIYTLNKGKTTATREKILQRFETDEKLLKDCLTWMVKQ